MDPLDRNEAEEFILEDMIAGDDVANRFLNESGEGDESLNRDHSDPDGLGITPNSVTPKRGKPATQTLNRCIYIYIN